MTLAEAPDVLTFAQAREILGVGKSTLANLIDQNLIKARHAGRRILIPKTSILKYLDGVD